MSYEETVPVELEALEYTYGSSVSVLCADPLSILVAVGPFTGEDDAHIYVRADLALSLRRDYPDGAPDIELRNVKGLGDARAADVLSRLRQEAADSVGGMVLGLLIEAARDSLTAMNSPEGDCIFCMCSLLEGANGSGSRELMKLPCYHCFHFDCFARWWRWEQRSLHAKRKQIIEELSAAAGPKLHELGLIPNAQGLYTVLCPSCRLKVDPSDLAHSMPRLVPHKGSAAAEVNSGEEEQASSHTVELPEADMARLRQMQQAHARLFAAQKQKKGIVEESWSVSVGQQPSRPPGALSNGGVASGSAATNPNQVGPVSTDSTRQGRQSEKLVHSDRTAQMQRRHDEGSRDSGSRQRQSGKGAKLHRPRPATVGHAVRGLSSLQLDDSRTQRHVADKSKA